MRRAVLVLALVLASPGCEGVLGERGAVGEDSGPRDAGRDDAAIARDAGSSGSDAAIDAPVDARAMQDAGPTRTEGCGTARAAGREMLSFEIAGVAREVLIYVPRGYTGDEPLPLTFNLHGSGGTAAGQQDYSGIEPVADEKGFVVAAIQGYEGRWNVSRAPDRPDDVALAEAVLAWAARELCIDEARIFSTGYSGGARTSSRFACAMPGRIRAIAPVAGVRHDPPCDARGVSVLTLHGTSDQTNYYGGCAESDTACSRNGEWVEAVEPAVDDWRAANACSASPVVETIAAGVERRTFRDCAPGTEVIFYRVEGGTHVWQLVPNTASLVLDFFLAQPPR